MAKSPWTIWHCSSVSCDGTYFSRFFSILRCLRHGGTGGGYFAQDIELTEVMNHAVVSGSCDIHACGIKAARVGFTFITQHVFLGGLHQCGWQAFELCRSRQQR